MLGFGKHYYYSLLSRTSRGQAGQISYQFGPSFRYGESDLPVAGSPSPTAGRRARPHEQILARSTAAPRPPGPGQRLGPFSRATKSNRKMEPPSAPVRRACLVCVQTGPQAVCRIGPTTTLREPRGTDVVGTTTQSSAGHLACTYRAEHLGCKFTGFTVFEAK